MRLFGKVDGTVSRFDRAQWLSQPFDLAFAGSGPSMNPAYGSNVIGDRKSNVGVIGDIATHQASLAVGRTNFAVTSDGSTHQSNVGDRNSNKCVVRDADGAQ